MNKTKFSTKYTALISRAAAIAKMEGGAQIERRHLLAALCAMSPKLLNRLLGCNQLYFVGELPFQDVSSLEPCKMAFSREAYRVLSLYGGVLGRVVEATDANLIDIHHVGAALLIDDSPDSPVSELLAVNGITVDKAAVFEALRRMSGKGAKRRREREVYRAVGNIRKQMTDEVVGQEQAVDKVCDSMLANWLLPPGERTTPLAFTIVGKSCSGKTLFANVLSKAIAQNSDATVTVLNGGLFASENTAHDCIGYDGSWRGGAKLGTFTGPVIDNPAAVIIVDNAELLHPISRSHIMRAITSGRLRDDMTGQDVSFRRATIILLTSAGCDGAYFDDVNADKPRTRILEELTSGIQDQNRRDNVTAFAQVSNELVMMRGQALVWTSTSDELSCCIDNGVVVKSAISIVMSFIRRAARTSGEVAPIVKATVGDPIRKVIMDSKVGRVGSVEVEIDSDGEVEVNTVAKNLAMRKRRLVTASASFEGSQLVLRIKSGDFVLLPAVNDGFIKIAPPKAGDSFDKLVGLGKPIAVLRQCIRYLHGETSINPGCGFMFRGGPGTGKSCLARSLAYEAGVPYVLLNCAELVSPEAIANIFCKLRIYGKSGLVAIFDEIDAIGGDRDDNKSPAYIERLNLLLENIDGIANDTECRIVYVGLTNRMEAICRITPAPDEKLLDFMARTTEDMPGSMLKAIVHELAYQVSESKPLTREMYAKAREIVVHGESTTTVKLDDEQLYSCGVHEAGHALACDAVGRVFVQASIVEDGSSRQGYVESSDKTRCTSTSILDSIDIALAGLAGQEVMGLPPSGGESDLQKAKELAFGYIRNGFCSEWGLLYLEEPDERMKELARKIIEERYCKVKQMLLASKTTLRQFARMLIERKTVFHDDLRMIKKALTKKGAEYGNEV